MQYPLQGALTMQDNTYKIAAKGLRNRSVRENMEANKGTKHYVPFPPF